MSAGQLLSQRLHPTHNTAVNQKRQQQEQQQQQLQ